MGYNWKSVLEFPLNRMAARHFQGTAMVTHYWRCQGSFGI